MKIDYFDTSLVSSNLKNKSISGGLYTVGAQVYQFLSQLIYTVVLARLLSPSDFGIVAMVAAVVNFAMLFKDAGLSTATIQKEHITHNQVSGLFWLNLMISLILSGILFASSSLIALFYEDGRLTQLTWVYASTFVLSGLSVQHLALLRRQMQFGKIAIIDCTATTVGIVLAVVAASYGLGYWSLVVLPVFRAIFSCAGVWIACRWVPSIPKPEEEMKQMMFFGGHLTAFSFVNYFSRNLDNILIGKFIGQEQLGLYSRAYALLLLPLSQLRGPLSSVALPTLSAIQADVLRYRKNFLRAQRAINFIALAPIPILFVSADWVIEVVLGQEWLAVATTFSYLSLAAAVQILMIAPGWLFTTQGRGQDLFQAGLWCSIVAIASFIVGLRWGIDGVALAYSLSGLFLRAPIFIYWAGRTGPVGSKLLFREIFPYFFLLCTVAFILYLLRFALDIDNPVLGIFITISADFLLMGLSYLIIKPIRLSVNELYKSLKQRKGKS